MMLGNYYQFLTGGNGTVVTLHAEAFVNETTYLGFFSK